MILQGADARHGPSFSLRNRAARALWGVVWLLLYRPSPRPFHGWRIALLRLFGARIGQSVRIHASCQVWAPWQLQIGDRVGIGERTNIYNMAAVTVGNDAVVSQGAYLCCGSHDYSTPNFQLTADEIHIGDQAWVCTEAFIGPGVTVPPGSVIGARTVLTRTPREGAWSVHAGNPARFIKYRQIQS